MFRELSKEDSGVLRGHVVGGISRENLNLASATETFRNPETPEVVHWAVKSPKVLYKTSRTLRKFPELHSSSRSFE